MLKIKYFSGTILLSLIAIAAFPPVAATDEKLKVGFVYVNEIRAHGWNHQHDQSRKYLVKQLGDSIETFSLQHVTTEEEMLSTIVDMASGDFDLIFFTSGAHTDSAVAVANRFPNVKFENATGEKRSKNLATYSARFYEGRYVSGRIAGAMTKSNRIGYVAAFPIPEIIRGINSFTIGLREVNPEAIVEVVWVSSWNNPERDREATKFLIDRGADIIAQHTDSIGTVIEAEEQGVFVFGQTSDMRDLAPTTQLTAIIPNWGQYYVDRVNAVIDGSWTSGDSWRGMAENAIQLADFNRSAIPPEVIADAEETITGIRAGTIHPFSGPIYDQNGNEIVSAGENLSDEHLLGMNYYVQGVQGSIPN